MAVNEAFVGRVYPPTPAYEVGREKIREFATAIAGDDAVHPFHVDPDAARAAGYPDVIAPPTFAIVIAAKANDQYIDDPESGIDYSRVVHGEQRFVHHRPITAGDRLTAVLNVDSIRSAGGHSMLVIRSEIGTEAGEPVCTATGVIVVRGDA